MPDPPVGRSGGRLNPGKYHDAFLRDLPRAVKTQAQVRSASLALIRQAKDAAKRQSPDEDKPPSRGRFE